MHDTIEPDSEDEDHQDHHSDQEYENEMDDDEWDAQQAWNNACFSSDEEEQDSSPGWLCKQCGKKEPSIRELSDHNFDHLKDPPFNCNICPFSSNQKGKIRLHMRRHGDENKQILGQAQAPWERSSDDWKFDVPRKPQPNRTIDTLYVSGLMLVPGKSEVSEPEGPQVEACEKHHLGERRISSLYEKCPNSKNQDSCQVPRHLQERGRKKFLLVGPPPSPPNPFTAWDRY